MTEVLPPAFWQGVEQFNQQHYYDCHDTLEALWMEAVEPEKTFYQGILQIAVALYHLGNRNYRGAMILLGEGINRLRRYQTDQAEIDIDALIDQSVDLLGQLQQADSTQAEQLAAQISSDRANLAEQPTASGLLTIQRTQERRP